MIAPIFVANSLILISVRYDITTSQAAHRRILKVTEFIMVCTDVRMNLSAHLMICKFFFLEPNGF